MSFMTKPWNPHILLLLPCVQSNSDTMWEGPTQRYGYQEARSEAHLGDWLSIWKRTQKFPYLYNWKNHSG